MKSKISKLLKSKNLIYYLLILTILLLYGKSIFFKFTFLDDDLLLISRSQFLDNFANIIKSFQEPVFYLATSWSTYYRPILNVFFILEYKLFGSGYWGYHLFNILVHILNTALVYKLFLKLKIDKKVAAVSAAIFAVHPITAQAVAWVPGLNDTLLALFFLASFLYLINYIQGSHFKDLFFYFLFFILSIFTKESALAFVALYMIYYFVAEYKKSVKQFLKIFIPSGLIILLFFFLRSKAIDINVTTGWLINSVKESFFAGFAVNLGKIFFPVNLSVLPILSGNNYIWGITALVILVSIIIFSKERKHKLLILGLTLFFLTFLPTLIKPNPNEQLVIFEHRLYIPLMGILLALGGTSLFKKYFVGKNIFIIILIVFFATTFVHADKFKDAVSFWESAKATSGSFSRTKANLALVYYSNGDLVGAKKLLNELIELEKYDSFSHNNLGVIYTKEGNFDAAIAEFNKAIEIDRFSSKAYLNLGYIYKSRNELDKAKDYFRYAIYTDQDNIDAMMNLASIYLDEGNEAKAQMIYDEVKKHGVEF